MNEIGGTMVILFYSIYNVKKISKILSSFKHNKIEWIIGRVR